MQAWKHVLMWCFGLNFNGSLAGSFSCQNITITIKNTAGPVKRSSSLLRSSAVQVVLEQGNNNNHNGIS
jgi:hypothetical protein